MEATSGIGEITGRWAVGVSGGADSVALLAMLYEETRRRKNLSLHAIHLDHETRGKESTEDARFVKGLCDAWGLAYTLSRLSEVEAGLINRNPNSSARYREARLTLFRKVVLENKLRGVLLAHHADDQAETVLHRLIRGGGPATVGGMAKETCLDGLTIRRPLLDVSSRALREWLIARNQPWREDQSNQSDAYLRNRLRSVLVTNDALKKELVAFSSSITKLNKWVQTTAPILSEKFETETLARLPQVLARHAVQAWLVSQGAASEEASTASADRLIAMAGDASTPARQHFPGGNLVARRGGLILVLNNPPRY